MAWLEFVVNFEFGFQAARLADARGIACRSLVRQFEDVGWCSDCWGRCI